MNYDLIITIVNRGYADLVMDAAKIKGATGGTIITGRGTGTKEVEKFFNITIQPEKEIVMILAENSIRSDIMESIRVKAGLNTVGGGISFSLPVDETLGLKKDEK